MDTYSLYFKIHQDLESDRHCEVRVSEIHAQQQLGITFKSHHLIRYSIGRDQCLVFKSFLEKLEECMCVCAQSLSHVQLL